MSIPGLLILLTVMSVVGRGVLQIIVVLGVLGGIGGSRVVRGAVIAAKEQVYFEAARAVGSSRWRTLVHHLLPTRSLRGPHASDAPHPPAVGWFEGA